MNRYAQTFFYTFTEGVMSLLVSLFIIAAPMLSYGQKVITTGTLLNEMTDAERLTRLPDKSYQTIQF